MLTESLLVNQATLLLTKHGNKQEILVGIGIFPHKSLFFWEPYRLMQKTGENVHTCTVNRRTPTYKVANKKIVLNQASYKLMA